LLFERRLREGIRDGTITVAFRRWRRPQVVAGRRYRTGADMIEVDSVDVVDVDAITAADAARAGYPSAAGLAADLRGAAELPIFRIRFRRLAEPDPRATLAATELRSPTEAAELDRRLGRLDLASPHGSWTAAVLGAIAIRPGVAASILAESFGLEKATFKRRVRALKELGLTVSLETGYRLSPRGESYRRLSIRGGADARDESGRT
jgi:hypothetical protein